MSNIRLEVSTFAKKGYTKTTYRIKGNLTSANALELKRNMEEWFSNESSECVIDLFDTRELDVVGINLLVKLRMVARKNNMIFYVKSPYINGLVEAFEQTKMTIPLNVVYSIRNTMRVAS